MSHYKSDESVYTINESWSHSREEGGRCPLTDFYRGASAPAAPPLPTPLICKCAYKSKIVEIVSSCIKALRLFLASHTLIQYGSVPLEMAAGEGHAKIVQRLLKAGANVNYQNKV